MSTPIDDLRQVAAEDEIERAELDAVIDLGEEGAAALEQLRREPDDDQPDWRRAA